jgi:hypothetical protein
MLNKSGGMQLGDAEDILGCVEMLEDMGEGEAAEMDMYGETSE